MKPSWYQFAKLFASSPDLKVGLLDSDKNQADPRYIWEGSIPTMKLFVRGRKQSPILYEGPREIDGWTDFVAKHCGLGDTRALVQAQWVGYAHKHGIAERLAVACKWFIEKDRLDVEQEVGGETLWNAHRWLSLFFFDPMTFGQQWSDPGPPKQPPPIACGSGESSTGANDRHGATAVATRDGKAAVAATTTAQVEDPLERLLAQYREEVDGQMYGKLDEMLQVCKEALCARSFPDDVFGTLGATLLYQNQSATLTYRNDRHPDSLPEAVRSGLHNGAIEQWAKRRHAEPMSSVQVKRAWPRVLEAIRSVNGAPMHQRAALKAQMMSTIRDLVRRGLAVNAQPFEGSMVMHAAGMGPSHLPLLTRLYFSGADVSQPARNGALPIEVASSMGHEDVVKRLYQMGSGVGRALHCAVTEAQMGVVKLLIESLGVPADLRWNDYTALDWAVILGRKDIASYLIRRSQYLERALGARVCEDQLLLPGSNVAHLLAKLGGRRKDLMGDVRKYKDGLLFKTKNQGGQTPQSLAESYAIKSSLDDRLMGCWTILNRTLLRPGWPRTAGAGSVESERAAQLAELERLILHEGADPQASNNIGWTALMVATLCCAADFVTTMLSAVERRDEGDKTCAQEIMYATSASGHSALLWAHWMEWVHASGRGGNADAQAKASAIVKDFAVRGATMRTRDKEALKALQASYERGDESDRSLLCFDPAALHVVDVKDQSGGAGNPALSERQGELGNLRPLMYRFYPPEYAPTDANGSPLSLEEFLRDVCSSAKAPATFKPVWAPDFPAQHKQRTFFAPDFEHDVETLLVSAKLFVQDRVALGLTLPPAQIFAVHIYTLYTNIFRDANEAMRDLDWPRIRLWRPFIYYLCQALESINACTEVVFRGLSIRNEPTAKAFIEGEWPKLGDPAKQERIPKYLENSLIMWPSFSSTTTDYTIALGYAGTHNINDDSPNCAVILKLFTQRTKAVEIFSYFTYERELLYPPNAAFRVTGYYEANSFNLRRGTHVTAGTELFHIDIDHFTQGALTLEEASKRKVLMIELVEEPLDPRSYQIRDEASDDTTSEYARQLEEASAAATDTPGPALTLTTDAGESADAAAADEHVPALAPAPAPGRVEEVLAAMSGELETAIAAMCVTRPADPLEFLGTWLESKSAGQAKEDGYLHAHSAIMEQRLSQALEDAMQKEMAPDEIVPFVARRLKGDE